MVQRSELTYKDFSSCLYSIHKCNLIILSFAIFLEFSTIHENCLTKPAIIYLDIDMLDREGEVMEPCGVLYTVACKV